MIGICGLAIGFSIGVNEDIQSAHDHSEQDFISGIESETTYQVEGYELGIYQ
ncbi:MAG: hypothetical protein N2513_03260 [Deltaproteobacteria bacterium]|nr:hypothetical protein [Deltaproteobacteria bacterium]